MVIVDRDLRRLIGDGTIGISSIDEDFPFDDKHQIGPGSVDLRLNNIVRKYKDNVREIDLSVAGHTESFHIPADDEIMIYPHEILMATTLEIVILPSNIAGFVTGRSSIARLGLMVHVSQHYIQPGHSQLIPLQLVNVTNLPIRIKPFIPICQVAFIYASSNAQVPYGSKRDAKYLDELTAPDPSKIGEELGLDRPGTLPEVRSEKHRQVQAQVAQLKRKNIEASLRKNFKRQLSRIMFANYLVLGASISVFLDEIAATPFPSLKLIVSGVFIVFCLVITFVANWRS